MSVFTTPYARPCVIDNYLVKEWLEQDSFQQFKDFEGNM